MSLIVPGLACFSSGSTAHHDWRRSLSQIMGSLAQKPATRIRLKPMQPMEPLSRVKFHKFRVSASIETNAVNETNAIKLRATVAEASKSVPAGQVQPRTLESNPDLSHFQRREIGANLRTKILDVRGFDPGRILSLRGGILMSIGIFPESLSQAILAGRFLVGRLGVAARPHRGDEALLRSRRRGAFTPRTLSVLLY